MGKDGIVYRYVTVHIGNFKGKPARMAAFCAFPKGAKTAALLHLHGGGQRVFLHEVEFYATVVLLYPASQRGGPLSEQIAFSLTGTNDRRQRLDGRRSWELRNIACARRGQ